MEVQRELSQIIRSEIKDPRIHPLTSVVAVEVTPDLKYCKAYISVLGDEEAGKATIEGPVSYTHLQQHPLSPVRLPHNIPDPGILHENHCPFHEG